MALLRGRPLGLVKLPPSLELGFELGAQGEGHVGLKLLDRQLPVAVCVHALERVLIHLLLGAVTLRHADCLERTGELAHVEHAVAIGIKLHENLSKRPTRLLRRLLRTPCRISHRLLGRELILLCEELGEGEHRIGREAVADALQRLLHQILQVVVLKVLHDRGRLLRHGEGLWC